MSDTAAAVEDAHPYDRGYWARYGGQPRPDAPKLAQEGWDDCDAELKAEAEAALSVSPSLSPPQGEGSQ